ncbi:hypothetical protein LCGC14_1773420 [marine sediment metagenome]|uniref:Uncharacterized protein n=1 Tax=marine sediment metagenome TaxID=412755 RepID=A0A0F9JCH7_9ZZZZ
MTDLTTKTAQSLHDKWCEQMREKGWHGPAEDCTESWLSGEVATQAARKDCKSGFDLCRKFHADLIPWPDLPESRRQEYLATAKAVLPEIVEAVVEECSPWMEHSVDKSCSGVIGECTCGLENFLLRDRRLEGLK